VRISEQYGRSRPVYSFEFFPPKSDQAAEDLIATVADLKEALHPDFVSVTYGAGGSTRTRTLECVTGIKKRLGIEVMAHLACMGHTREELHDIVTRLRAEGIENILALRGDPPKDPSSTAVGDHYFRHATELIRLLKERSDVCVGAACYPEVHPEATSATDDLLWARRKVELGAEFLITQLFFDNRHYFSFKWRAREAGIEAPIVPGIMPITNVAQIERFTKMCGAHIPGELRQRLDKHREDPGVVMAIGIEHAITQCRDLINSGAPGIHFYTLNRSHATRSVLAALKRL